MGQQFFMQALQGKMSVKDALNKWQTEGDAALKAFKENPNAIPTGPNGISKEF
jgi:multiple sugar transport system substrate-binding protein